MTEFRRGVPKKASLEAHAAPGAGGQESVWQVRGDGFGGFLRGRLRGDGVEWAFLLPGPEGAVLAFGAAPREAWEFRPAHPVTFEPRPWQAAADPVEPAAFAAAALALDTLARDFERRAVRPGTERLAGGLGPAPLGQPESLLEEACTRESLTLRRAAAYLRDPEALRRGGVTR